MKTPGQVAFEAYHRDAMRRMDYEDLRPAAKRLWESAADATVIAKPADQRAGETFHAAYMEDTGLALGNLLRFSDLGETAQAKWTAAGLSVVRKVAARAA